MKHAHKVFSALSDPTRRAMLVRLAGGEATVMELAAPFSISQPAISRHIKVLQQAGLVSRRVDGSRRPCRLEPGALAVAESWLASLHPAQKKDKGKKKKKKKAKRR